MSAITQHIHSQASLGLKPRLSIHSIGDFSLKLHNQTKNGKCKFKVRFLRSSWTLRLAYDEALDDLLMMKQLPLTYIYIYIYICTYSIIYSIPCHTTMVPHMTTKSVTYAWSVCDQIKMKSNDQSRVNQGRNSRQSINYCMKNGTVCVKSWGGA